MSETFQTLIICGTVLMAAFLILLAMPQSKLARVPGTDRRMGGDRLVRDLHRLADRHRPRLHTRSLDGSMTEVRSSRPIAGAVMALNSKRSHK